MTTRNTATKLDKKLATKQTDKKKLAKINIAQLAFKKKVQTARTKIKHGTVTVILLQNHVLLCTHNLNLFKIASKDD